MCRGWVHSLLRYKRLAALLSQLSVARRFVVVVLGRLSSLVSASLLMFSTEAEHVHAVTLEPAYEHLSGSVDRCADLVEAFGAPRDEGPCAVSCSWR